LDWWRGFGSARELTLLMEEAQTAISTIAVAVALILQADAQVRNRQCGAVARALRCQLTRTRAAHRDLWQRRPVVAPARRVSGELASTISILSARLHARFVSGRNRATLLAADETAIATPLQQGGGRPHDAGERRQRLFSGAGFAGPAANRA